MKKKYNKPEFEVEYLDKIDVITVSDEDSDDIEFVPDDIFN